MTFAAPLAAADPTAVALRDADRCLTWSEVDEQLKPAVNALLSLGLSPPHRVAVFAQNSAETVLAYAACTLAGTSAVAVNSHLKAEEAAYILEDSRAQVVLCDATTAAVAVEAAQRVGITHIAAWNADSTTLPPGVPSWAGWCEKAGSHEPPTSHEPRRTLVYTSGTTGRPKGVELPPTSWVGGTDIDEHLERLAMDPMIEHGPHLVVGPLYHSGPLAGTRLFLGGARLSVLGRFDAATLLRRIEEDRIGSTIMVPTHFQRLLALPVEQRRSADVSSLRFALQVGAACPVDVKRSLIEWWGPVVWESYGASEVGTTCLISAAEWLERPGSVGRSIPPFEAQVRLPDGSVAPPGVEGALWFRDESGHGVRYLSGQRSDELFTLGEIGRMDEDGYVWITDRLADMVVSGGVNIYPAEVEQRLARHHRVGEVACYGVPDPEMGERLVAIVAARDADDPPEPEELRAWCRDHIAGYKVPRSIRIVDALPRTSVGKLDKRAMRRRHEEQVPAGDALSRLGTPRSP